MNGNSALLDSNVLIFISKGLLDLKSLRSGHSLFYTSIISYIEVYAYDFANDAEREVLDRVFKNIEIVTVTSEVADETIAYRKNKSKKIELPDAIILASAKIIGADLITDNLRDLKGIDPSVTVLDLGAFKV